MLRSIKPYIPERIEGLFVSMGEPPYRGRQLIRWIYRKGVTDFSMMTDLSKDLRERLSREFVIGEPSIIDIRESVDGTRRFVIEVDGGDRVESVLIPDRERLTLCVSTQVGCGMGCRFCLTGRGGFKRNLRAYEMAEQVLAAINLSGQKRRITNIVLMGMGEPLSNYDEVKLFIGLITSHDTWALSTRRITVSTAGIPHMIERMGRELNVKLAVSLNAASDEKRSMIMPINRRYPISELIDACRRFPLKRGRRITFEYVLLDGINDSLDDARMLASLIKGMPSKVNLIPFNPFPGCEFSSPPVKRVLEFQEFLRNNHITAFIRESRGLDISAACGLLTGERDLTERSGCDSKRACSVV